MQAQVRIPASLKLSTINFKLKNCVIACILSSVLREKYNSNLRSNDVITLVCDYIGNGKAPNGSMTT